MGAYVLTDQALEKQAERFVWLFVDVDDPANAGFLEQYPIKALPALLVIDGKDERVLLTWSGGATVAQLERLFEDGTKTYRGEVDDPVAAALARADGLHGQGAYADAAAGYEQVLHLCSPDWPGRSRVVESLVTALEAAGDGEACARVALREAHSLPPGPSYANTVALGLYCALSAPDGEVWPGEVIPSLEDLLEKSLSLDSVLADERSSHYYLLTEARESAGDPEGARAYAGAWAAFLEAEAARAPTPEARSAFDSHLLTACIRLGDPARAIPALERSERDLPGDYNPSARLAAAYLELERYDEALEAVNRALAKVYGPRKLRVYLTRAKILEKMGRQEEAMATLEEAVSFAETLPASQRSESAAALLRSELERMAGGPSQP